MSENGDRYIKTHPINRRKFMRDSAAGAASVYFSSAMAAMGASGDRPNIILFTADDLGWRELGCFGNPHIQTPNIDEIASGGVRFTNAFVTAPSCSASRSSIMTGQMPHSVGVLGLTHVHRQYQMPESVPTMARVLRDAGYSTAIQGKWHVAPFRSVKKYGYDDRMNFMKVPNSKNARKFITKNKDRPFFIEINFMQTHRLGNGTFKMDPQFPVDPDSIEVPPYWQIPNWPEIRNDVAMYFSQAAGMDLIIGEIMDHLESEGLADKTLVVFVSDNGPPYPGCKITCYDRGIGTPIIMRWPRGLPSGKVRNQLVSTIDIMPTCLEAAALPVPETVQGSSLMGVATGNTNKVHDEIFAEVTYHVHYAPMRAIRTREWKYIENLSPDPTGLDQTTFEWAQKLAKEPGQKCCVERPPEELFNIANDPDEKVNLALDDNYSDIKTKLKNKLHAWRKKTRDPFPDI